MQFLSKLGDCTNCPKTDLMSRPRARKQVKANGRATNDADYKNEVKNSKKVLCVSIFIELRKKDSSELKSEKSFPTGGSDRSAESA